MATVWKESRSRYGFRFDHVTAGLSDVPVGK